MRSWDAGNRTEFLGTQPRIGSDHGKLAQSLAEWIRPRAVLVRAGPAPRSPPIRRPPLGPRGDDLTPTADVRARLARRSLLRPRVLRLARRRIANRGRSREFFARCCFEADERLGEPAACRWFLNWFDDAPRDTMRRELLAEVDAALAERIPRALPAMEYRPCRQATTTVAA